MINCLGLKCVFLSLMSSKAPVSVHDGFPDSLGFWQWAATLSRKRSNLRWSSFTQSLPVITNCKSGLGHSLIVGELDKLRRWSGNKCAVLPFAKQCCLQVGIEEGILRSRVRSFQVWPKWYTKDELFPPALVQGPPSHQPGTASESRPARTARETSPVPADPNLWKK